MVRDKSGEIKTVRLTKGLGTLIIASIAEKSDKMTHVSGLLRKALQSTAILFSCCRYSSMQFLCNIRCAFGITVHMVLLKMSLKCILLLLAL